jgi:hypothetical protein
METAQHWDRMAKNQPAEIAMFQISEVQESPAFNGRRSFLTLRCAAVGEVAFEIDTSLCPRYTGVVTSVLAFAGRVWADETMHAIRSPKTLMAWYMSISF